MAIITLFWKDQIGLSLTEILLLQGIFSISMVVMEYPSGYLSDRIGYRTALNFASLLGIIGWGLYTVADSFSQVLIAEVILGFSISFISGSDSALLYESLKSDGEERFYARHEGLKSSIGQLGEACGAIFAGLLYASAPLLPFIYTGVGLDFSPITDSLHGRTTAKIETTGEPSCRGLEINPFRANRKQTPPLHYYLERSVRVDLLLPNLADPALHAGWRCSARLVRASLGWR